MSKKNATQNTEHERTIGTPKEWKSKSLIKIVFAVCAFNFGLHMIGLHIMPKSSLLKASSYFTESAIISESSYAYFEFIITLGIQVALSAIAILFLLIRRIASVVTGGRVSVESTRWPFVSMVFPTATTLYISNSFFSERLQSSVALWFFGGLAGMLMMATIAVLLACIAEPNKMKS